ncbi:MAG: nucleotidyl transferase AbiEii/AbiGii toxin family protein [Thermoplasmatales archaeon]|jgi:predicted nucleotidyltransferase component of viral defense system
MKIPLANQLKKRQQVEISILQDEMVRIVYNISVDSVLHGGTSVWRCYSGKRFSEDLDFYSMSFPDLVDNFRREISAAGLSITKMKDTGNVIFSQISDGRVEVRLEINHKRKGEGIPVKYELSDGSYTEVLSLSPNQIILEKIAAYTDRRFVRDIYDIYHLSSVTDDLSSIKDRLSVFLDQIEKPVDEQILRSLVYIGNPPTFERMIAELRRLTK